MGTSFYEQGLQFACTQCSKCCRFDPGYVFLSHQDLHALAEGLSLTMHEVTERYCRRVDTGLVSRLSLNEQSNYDCVFWYNGGCQVYEFRPLQCRTYPFWEPIVSDEESWKAEARECPGMGVGRLHNGHEISQRLRARRNAKMVGDRDES